MRREEEPRGWVGVEYEEEYPTMIREKATWNGSIFTYLVPCWSTGLRQAWEPDQHLELLTARGAWASQPADKPGLTAWEDICVALEP